MLVHPLFDLSVRHPSIGGAGAFHPIDFALLLLCPLGIQLQVSQQQGSV